MLFLLNYRWQCTSRGFRASKSYTISAFDDVLFTKRNLAQKEPKYSINPPTCPQSRAFSHHGFYAGRHSKVLLQHRSISRRIPECYRHLHSRYSNPRQHRLDSIQTRASITTRISTVWFLSSLHHFRNNWWSAPINALASREVQVLQETLETKPSNYQSEISFSSP